MAIKKAFQDLVAFLEENSNSKVKTLLPAVIDMCSAKSGGAGGGSNFIKNAEGVVTHIFCYYHKRYEPVNADGSVNLDSEGNDDGTVCEYGAKATSATGLNSMCKEGVSNWTKQQAAAKKASLKLLEDVGAGEVEPSDIADKTAEIEAARVAVVAREDGLGTEDKPA